MVESHRIIREYITTLQAGTDQIFPLLCPIREYDWIPQWRCTMLYSSSGVAELGCVFKTDFEDIWGEEIWVVSHYQPDRKIAFVRTGLLRATRYHVTLEPKGNLTAIKWSQELTGLSREGDRLVAGYSQEEFEKLMVPLNKMLGHYLKTGEPLIIK